MNNSIVGTCHCGNIRYVLRTFTAVHDITLRICRCDFCLRHRPRYWSDSRAQLEISVGNPGEIKRYRFGHGTADFVICTGCGVFCFAVTEDDNGYRAVTNMNLALDKDAALQEVFLEALAENEAERQVRRLRNWTPVTSGWPPEG